MKTLLVLVALVAVLVSDASGQSYGSAILFGGGYAKGQCAVGLPFPGAGASIWIAGTVESFSAPIADLTPPAGTYEATYVMEEMTCTGLVHWSSPDGNGGTTAELEGGFLRIYLDQTPDANPADSSSFRDGELVLEASLDGTFYITESGTSYLCPYPDPTEDATFSFTGGSWFDHVSFNGTGFKAVFEGCYFPYPYGDPLLQMGYFGLTRAGVIDIQGPIAVQKSSWGKIKALYR